MDRSDSLSLHRPRLAWLPTLRCAALPFPPALLSLACHQPLAASYACRCRRCAAFTVRSLNLTYSTLHFGASAPKKIDLPLTVQRRLTNTCMPRRECCPHKTRVSKPNVFLSILVPLSKTLSISGFYKVLWSSLSVALFRTSSLARCRLFPQPSLKHGDIHGFQLHWESLIPFVRNKSLPEGYETSSPDIVTATS